MLKLGIIGHPLGHTLSPVLHGELMKHLGITGEYGTYDIPTAAELPGALRRFAEEGFRGLNVTLPYKTEVCGLLGRLSPAARQIGAVNTLVIDEHGIAGDNTDAAGFLQSLPADWAARLPDTSVLVLGGGGAARAVLYALSQLDANAVTVAVRSPERAFHLRADFAGLLDFDIRPLDGLQDLGNYTALINTTPVGMGSDRNDSPMDWAMLQSLPAGSWVYDLIYQPVQTRLLREARQHGYHTQGGLRMLVLQGVLAFERWSGKEVSDSLLPDLEAALAARL